MFGEQESASYLPDEQDELGTYKMDSIDDLTIDKSVSNNSVSGMGLRRMETS